LYRLPDQPKTPGFRQLKEADCPQVAKLLNNVSINQAHLKLKVKFSKTLN